MGHRKKVFTALFVIFAALISSVAGGISLMDPARINSNAKGSTDYVTLRITFHIGADAYGTASRIDKTWDKSGKDPTANKAIGDLTVPFNHGKDGTDGTYVWSVPYQTDDKDKPIYGYDSEGNYVFSGRYEQKTEYNRTELTFDFEQKGYVFTGWREGTSSGPNTEYGQFYKAGDSFAGLGDGSSGTQKVPGTV